MKIAMASDHGGFHLKEHIKKYLQDKGIEVVDHRGTYSEESVDYPDFAEKLCQDITSGESGAERGIFNLWYRYWYFYCVLTNVKASERALRRCVFCKNEP